MSPQDRIKLEIVTTRGVVLSTMVERFTAPGALGSTGVLYHHAPMVSLLEPGLLTYVQDGATHVAAIGGGLLEIREDKALVLVDTGELPEELDLERAVAEEAKAKETLHHATELTQGDARRNWLRATARRKAAQSR